MNGPTVIVNFVTDASISGNEATLEADILTALKAAAPNLSDDGAALVRVAGSATMKKDGSATCALVDVMGTIQSTLTPESIAIFKKDVLASILSVTSVPNARTIINFHDTVVF